MMPATLRDSGLASVGAHTHHREHRQEAGKTGLGGPGPHISPPVSSVQHVAIRGPCHFAPLPNPHTSKSSLVFTLPGRDSNAFSGPHPPHYLCSKHNLLQEGPSPYALRGCKILGTHSFEPMSLPTLSPTLRSDPRCAKAAASAQNCQNSSWIQNQPVPSPSPLPLPPTPGQQLSTTHDLLTRSVAIREFKRS